MRVKTENMLIRVSSPEKEAFALAWMDNEQGSYNYWQDMTQEALQDAKPTQYSDYKQVAVRELEDMLKNEHEEALPELTGFASDLLGAAMSEVNWREIAESLVSDVLENHPELERKEA